MTRYERIMKMTVEALAEWLATIPPCKCCVRKDRYACSGIYCQLNIKKWLEKECDDELPPLRPDEDED